MNLVFPAAIALVSLAGVAIAESTRITGQIDYQSPDPDNSILFKISEADGEIIWLDLSLISARRNSTFGYTINEFFEVPFVDDIAESVAECSEGNLGVIDNYSTNFTVSFGNPTDYHAPTYLYVGTRQLFPLNSIKCEQAFDGDLMSSKLSLRGYFAVASSTIPTAQETYLFPATP